jgi:ParB family chromosome partitioning protein
MSDRAKLELALIENVQREDLNSIEEARAYQRLIDEFSLTQEQVAKKVGKSRPAIANILRLLNLPAQIQRAVIEGKISEGHARGLLPLEENREQQLHVFDWIVKEGVTVRDVENRVRELKNLPLKPYIRQTVKGAADPEVRALEDSLRQRLGTKVRLQRTGNSGRIMIEFFSQEEFDNLLRRLNDLEGN